jgi:hypothetical protein
VFPIYCVGKNGYPHAGKKHHNVISHHRQKVNSWIKDLGKIPRTIKVLEEIRKRLHDIHLVKNL